LDIDALGFHHFSEWTNFLNQTTLAQDRIEIISTLSAR
jgi:hypothetical protein